MQKSARRVLEVRTAPGEHTLSVLNQERSIQPLSTHGLHSDLHWHPGFCFNVRTKFNVWSVNPDPAHSISPDTAIIIPVLHMHIHTKDLLPCLITGLHVVKEHQTHRIQTCEGQWIMASGENRVYCALELIPCGLPTAFLMKLSVFTRDSWPCFMLETITWVFTYPASWFLLLCVSLVQHTIEFQFLKVTVLGTMDGDFHLKMNEIHRRIQVNLIGNMVKVPANMKKKYKVRKGPH